MGRRLPRRDFFLLPLLVVLTACVMLAGAEIGARLLMPEQPRDACMLHDPVLTQRAMPNCASETKSPESAWVQNRYNDCGYRSDTPCHAPLTDGARRIVAIGSSTGWGFQIPTAETWYTLVAASLGQACRRRVDVQNLGGLYTLDQTAATIPAALAEQPSVAVMFLGPFDFTEAPHGAFVVAGPHVARPAPAIRKSLLKRVNGYLKGSRAVVVAEHFLFQQPGTYIPLYLKNGDKADFLRQPFTPAWQARIAYVDAAMGFIAEKFNAAHVPLLVVFSPQEAQADIVSTGEQLPGVAPFALDDAVRGMAARHGFMFVDMTESFKRIPDASAYYLNVDGHLNARGQRLAGELVADRLRPEICAP